ncbi:MAG: hypothetical protein ABIP78_02715 [Pyrinomonadaceae bacterium]
MKVMKRDYSKTRVWGSIVLLFLVTVSPALGQWKIDDKKPSDTADRKSSNGFGAHLVAVKDPRAFIQEWLKPQTPKIKSATKTKPGESIGILVFFAGCKEVNGTCSSEVDYAIYKPDGTTFVERNAQPLWKEAAPPKSNIQLGRAILSFAFPKAQPSGKYRITAKVKDINADITLDLETQLDLKD